MALRIVSASEPIRVERIIQTIYGPPGTGKTSTGFTADAPLLLDTDGGVHRSSYRKDAVRAESWGDIASITREDVAAYRTLVVDTVGRALDLLAADIIRREPKMGRGGALTLQGFGRLKSEFASFLNLMRSFGLDIVLVAHSDEKMQNDVLIDRLDIQGASKNEIYKSSDAMARLSIVDGRRILSFSPTETQFGKDPASLGKVEVPHFDKEPEFLAGVLRKIKDTLNAENEQQVEARKQLEEWTTRCAIAKTAKQFTGMIAEAGDDRRMKKALLDAATEKGFQYDPAAKAFTRSSDDDAGEPSESGELALA